MSKYKIYNKYHYTLCCLCTNSFISLEWCHNGRDGVSNHQPHDCLLNRLFVRRSKKISKLRVTGLCAGKSPGTSELPAQMASNAENVSIWWRHHVCVKYQPRNVTTYIKSNRYKIRSGNKCERITSIKMALYILVVKYALKRRLYGNLYHRMYVLQVQFNNGSKKVRILRVHYHFFPLIVYCIFLVCRS